MIKKEKDSLALQELQVKVAFLEDALSELSDEYFTQQKELQYLSIKVNALIGKLAESDNTEQQGEIMLDEKPPHY